MSILSIATSACSSGSNCPVGSLCTSSSQCAIGNCCGWTATTNTTIMMSVSRQYSGKKNHWLTAQLLFQTKQHSMLIQLCLIIEETACQV